MKAFRHRFFCEHKHEWHDTRHSESPPPDAVCPVCGKRPKLWAANEMADRPIIQIESAAILEKPLGRVVGDFGYFVVVSKADLSESVRSRFQLTWAQTVEVIKELKEMPYDKAAQFFVGRTESLWGIPDSERVKHLPRTKP